ncbi:MAG: right-handed parallel beta-helix repeat-containing protein [Terriglobia bacterium]
MRRHPLSKVLSCSSLALLLPVLASNTSSCGSSTLLSTVSPPAPAAATTYYVNCGVGHDTNSGTSSSAPWGSLNIVDATTFQPGDSILFARGSVCPGQLKPKGSGTSSSVITLADYGEGALPVISAGSNPAALTLTDQSYWEIRNLETTGGNTYGIWVTGNTANAVINHVYLSNVVVHDVTGIPNRKAAGLIVFATNGAGESFNDILVDGASAYNTTQWAGIYAAGATYSSAAGIKGTNITVRNCTVHDVGGDGIVVHIAKNALIENSTAYNTGQTTLTSLGTPGAIWNWDCDTCTVQFNEAYLSHSPTSQDGGDYDSDYYNNNNTIQYNYGHDADGYCLSVFSAEGLDTNVNTVIRYNVCSNNGRRPNNAGQGDFFYSTWDGGSILNSQVYNNTSYWNPASPTAPALNVQCTFDAAKPNYFANNIIVAAVPGMENYGGTLGKGLTSFIGTRARDLPSGE